MKRAVTILVAIAACSEPRTNPAAQPCDGDCTARVHPPGILDPTSPDFHTNELARHGWNLGLCTSCHGDDFAGGSAGVSCLSCHAPGPGACVTCHGPGAMNEPAGNHTPHAMANVDCAQCHIKPARWDDPGHLDHPPPATVTFGALANLTPAGGQRGGPAAWDETTCTNVYCHGDVTPRYGGAETQPRWDEAPPAFTCDRCHGAPPPDHLRADCVTCHPGGAAHVDGIVEVRPGAPPPTEQRHGSIDVL